MYVYVHKNPTTKDIFYVGIGQDRRAFSKMRSRFWKNYVKKYGQPIVEIINDNLSFEQACEIEINLIKLYGRRGYEVDGILVNRSLGGGLTSMGCLRSENTKKLIGDKQRGIPKHSNESKEAIRQSHLGRTCTEEQKDKMRKPRKEGTGDNISKANKGRVSPMKGKTRSKESIEKTIKNRDNKSISIKNKVPKPTAGPKRIPIIQYSINMEFIKEWESIIVASRELEIKYSQIHRNLTGLQKNKQFIWKYKNVLL
jgi:hypothetical protein